MSHNRKSTDLPTAMGPLHTRGRFNPDIAGMPSQTGNQFIPPPLDLNSNRSGTPPISLSQWQWIRPVISSADCYPYASNPLEPGGTSSSNQSLKRDFSTGFEDLDSSFRQSVERDMNLFPKIPKDARRRFLMQQSPEEFKFHCRTAALRAEWSYEAMMDSEIRATKAEEQVCILRSQVGAIQASLDEERQKKLQAYRAQEAAFKKVRELEVKLAAFERQQQQDPEQGRAHILEGRAYREHLMNDNARLEANVDESQDSSIGDQLSEPADVEHEQGSAATENRVNVIVDLEANDDESQEH